MRPSQAPDSSVPPQLDRRDFIKVCAGAGALAAIGYPSVDMAAQTDRWSAGDLAHVLPTASHERFLIKASFKRPLTFTPRLTVSGKPVDGFKTDGQGRFWRFDAPALSPNTTYQLRLTDPGGGPLCDAWPLKTFPAPSASPDRLRILAYTCGGGYDGAPYEGKSFFLDMTARRRLLARGLSFQPDLLIANGDQIYWDLLTTLNKPFAEFMKANYWPKFGGAIDISVQAGSVQAGDLIIAHAGEDRRVLRMQRGARHRVQARSTRWSQRSPTRCRGKRDSHLMRAARRDSSSRKSP